MALTLSIGSKAPAFSLPATDGRTCSLDDFAGLDNAFPDAVAGSPVRTPVTNPVGCNVKREGRDAHWMPPEACDLV